jgi:hypothetical protein
MLGQQEGEVDRTAVAGVAEVVEATAGDLRLARTGGDSCWKPVPGSADRLANAVKIAGDPSGQFSGGRVQWENLFGSYGGQESMQSLKVLGLLVSPDDFKNSDGREGIIAKYLSISFCLSCDGRMFPFADLGQGIRVEQCLIRWYLTAMADARGAA